VGTPPSESGSFWRAVGSVSGSGNSRPSRWVSSIVQQGQGTRSRSTRPFCPHGQTVDPKRRCTAIDFAPRGQKSRGATDAEAIRFRLACRVGAAACRRNPGVAARRRPPGAPPATVEEMGGDPPGVVLRRGPLAVARPVAVGGPLEVHHVRQSGPRGARTSIIDRLVALWPALPCPKRMPPTRRGPPGRHPRSARGRFTCESHPRG